MTRLTMLRKAALTFAGATAVMVTLVGVSASEDRDDRDSRDPIVGAWHDTATRGGGTFVAVTAFHPGGIFSLIRRESGLGKWKRTGRYTYEVDFRMFTYDKVTGALTTINNAHMDLTLESDDVYLGTYTAVNTDPDGNVLSVVDGTREGRRF